MTNFKINPKLVTILGESYTSLEKAFKELVDNAWDADAENVWISIPNSFNNDPIIIKDDGSGMTDEEIKEEYLFVASSRLSRKGKYTISNGIYTKVAISKQEILINTDDLESISLPVQIDKCNTNDHYTKIELYGFNSNYGLPNIEKLKQLFILEYGREEDFRIYINGEQLGIEHIQGESFIYEEELNHAGKVKMHFTLSSDKKQLKNSGIIIRIVGKLVGKPTCFGLEEDDEIPRKLLRRVYGEINADKLADEVTIAWDAIIENSKGYQELIEWARKHLYNTLKNSYKKEFNLIKARYQKFINEGLSKLPEYRSKFGASIIL